MSVEEVRRLVEEATGQLRLHLLLMANCGMTQQDISDLRHDEVDWARGRVTRRRSKTRDRFASVPVVEYPLWPQTWELLQRYRSADPERVLVTEKGGPWVKDQIVNGKRSKTDNIKSAYVRLLKRINRGKDDSARFTKPLKLLRKTSSSLLDSHDHYGRFETHFLGQSPRGVAAISYVAPSVELFDRIVGWLGVEYRFLPRDGKGDKPRAPV
jgi:integrase